MKHPNQNVLGFVITFVLATGTACAGWTPPEASVTPPAVVTLDAFAATGVKGANPNGPLVVAPDGALYGSTFFGGTNGSGIIFRLTTGGAFTSLWGFSPDEGNPGPLTLGPDSVLYWQGRVLSYADGPFYTETLLRLATDGTFPPRVGDGDGLLGNLGPVVLGPDRAMYVTHLAEGIYPGAVFRVSPDGTTTNLHFFDFPGYGTNGSGPTGLLVAGPDAALYGSTSAGGISNNATIYRLTTGGTFTKLHDFNVAEGRGPDSLVVGPDGALYGSTYVGDTNYNESLFRLTTGGTFAKLHDLNDAPGGYGTVHLVAGPDGALYGSTYVSGTSGKGTLFRLTTGGSFTKLHDFNGTDGNGPNAAMVVGPDGALYGSTGNGGTNDNGTLFRLTTGGTFTKLHDFNGTNGQNPVAALVVGPDSALYGSTSDGGPHGGGIIFKLVLERPPVVSIARSNASVTLSWPVSALNFQLQGSTNLSLANAWSPVAQPAVTNAGQISVTVPTSVGRRFFRLKSQ